MAKEVKTNDMVHNPNHYTQGGIETIDIIKAKLTPEEFKGYCKGNILKYITREKWKNGLEDIRKADVYMDYLIDFMEGEKHEGQGTL